MHPYCLSFLYIISLYFTVNSECFLIVIYYFSAAASFSHFFFQLFEMAAITDTQNLRKQFRRLQNEKYHDPTESVDRGKENRIPTLGLGKPPSSPHTNKPASRGPLTTIMQRPLNVPTTEAIKSPSPKKPDIDVSTRRSHRRSPSPQKMTAPPSRGFKQVNSNKKLCKQFLMRGTCGFGSRCLYFHEKSQENITISSSTPSEKNSESAVNCTASEGLTPCAHTRRGPQDPPEVHEGMGSVSAPSSKEITISPIRSATQDENASILSDFMLYKSDDSDDDRRIHRHAPPPPPAAAPFRTLHSLPFEETAPATATTSAQEPEPTQRSEWPAVTGAVELPSVPCVDTGAPGVAFMLPSYPWPVSFCPSSQNIPPHLLQSPIPITSAAPTAPAVAQWVAPGTAVPLHPFLGHGLLPYSGMPYPVVPYGAMIPYPSFGYAPPPFAPVALPFGSSVFNPMSAVPYPAHWNPGAESTGERPPENTKPKKPKTKHNKNGNQYQINNEQPSLEPKECRRAQPSAFYYPLMLAPSSIIVSLVSVMRWATGQYSPKNWKAVSDASIDAGRVTSNFRSLECAVQEADKEKERRGFFNLPDLEYDTSAGIPPLCTKKQFDLQYHFFHRDAVERLNTHAIGSELEGHNLDVVVRQTSFDASRAVLHTSASEHFNYCFWYRSLRPWGTAVPTRLRENMQLLLSGNSGCDPIEEIKRRMTITALSQQNLSGWVYLVWTGSSFDVLHFQHGLCPITSDLIPLLCINLHHSAMCVDYKPEDSSSVEQYVRNFFKTCNWIHADRYYGAAMGKE
eukprot:gene6007-4312_t